MLNLLSTKYNACTPNASRPLYTRSYYRTRRAKRIMWGISEPIKLALCSRGQGREGERTADHYKELTKRTCTTEYTDDAARGLSEHLE